MKLPSSTYSESRGLPSDEVGGFGHPETALRWFSVAAWTSVKLFKTGCHLKKQLKGLTDKSGVVIIVDYSKEYPVMNSV